MSRKLTILMRDGSRREVDPDGLRALHLDGGALAPGEVLPESLEFLHLEGGSLPPDSVLPEGLRGLSLGGGTLPEGIELPNGLRGLSFSFGSLPPGTKLPPGLKSLDMVEAKLPRRAVIPTGCSIRYEPREFGDGEGWTPAAITVLMPDGKAEVIPPMRLETLDLGRGTLPPGTKLPRTLRCLNVDGGAVAPGVELPVGLRSLLLGGGTLPMGVELPEGLDELELGGGTLPKGTVLPDSLRRLSLSGGTLPPGTQLPEGLRYIWLGGGTLPQGAVIPEGCRVFGASLAGVFSDAPAVCEKGGAKTDEGVACGAEDWRKGLSDAWVSEVLRAIATRRDDLGIRLVSSEQVASFGCGGFGAVREACEKLFGSGEDSEVLRGAILYNVWERCNAALPLSEDARLAILHDEIESHVAAYGCGDHFSDDPEAVAQRGRLGGLLDPQLRLGDQYSLASTFLAMKRGILTEDDYLRVRNEFRHRLRLEPVSLTMGLP